MIRSIRPMLWFLLFFGFRAEAQENSGNFFIRNYSPKEYKAGIQNWSIVQDRRGVMYFGNGDCVLEYDGSTWRKIFTDKKAIVRSMTMDNRGTVFLGSVGEFGYLAPDSVGNLKFVSLVDIVPAEHRAFADVWKCFASSKGIYFQSFDKLFLFTDGRIRTWKPSTGFHQSYLVDDELYITQRQVGLMRVEGDSLRLLPGSEVFADIRLYAVLPYDSTHLLIGSREKGLFLYSKTGDKNSPRVIPFKTEADAFLLENQLYGGIVLPHGDFTLYTLRGGAVIMDRHGKIKQILDKSTGLQDNNIYTALTDREGGLWLGLNNGIARAEIESPLTAYGESSELAGAVLSIARHEGTLFVGTFRGLYYLRQDHRVDPHFSNVKEIAAQCYFLLPAGPYLLAATQDGVFSIRHSSVSLVQKQVSTLFLYRSKFDTMRIYVGIRDGMSYLEWADGRWQDRGRINGITEEVRTINEDNEGRLWLGTMYQGVVRVTPPRSGAGGKNDWIIEKFGTSHGLPNGSVYSYAVGGRTIFGTFNGIYRFDPMNNNFVPDPVFGRSLTAVPRLVSRLVVSDDGRVWMNAEAGNRAETYVAHPQPDGTYALEATPFLRLADFAVLALYCEKNGVVWLGGPNGLIRYDSKIVKNYREEFQALVRKVSIDRDSVIFGGRYAADRRTSAVIDYRNNSLRFEFSAASYDNESANLFQYRLEGFDDSWSDWTAETIKDYTNIPEGSYTFHVRAKNVYGHVGLEDNFRFTVSVPWYRTVWAYGLYGIVFFMVFYYAVKWRAQSLEKEKVRLEKIVEQRTIEVVRQKEKLEQKTTELETINAIVNSINSEVIFSDLLNSILHEISVIHGVEKGSALVFDRNREVFCFKAAKGWEMKELESIELTLQEAEARYVQNAFEIFEDVYIVRNVGGRSAEAKIRHLGIPKSMLVTRIRIEGVVEGYFIYDNMHYENAFEDQDILLLKNLKEHITSAFIKARMLEDLQVMNRQILRASEMKSKFMADMSHELRTPMNAILGFTDLLKQGMLGEINKDQEKALQAITESGTNLLQLINDILDLSKIEAGKLTLHPKMIYLEETVLSVRNLILSLLQKKKQELRIAIDPSIELWADEMKFRQVLFNLLSNANKFTPEGGRIGVEAAVINGSAYEEIEIRVSDNGKGIPPAELESVFEEFRQVEGETEHGTGLGLTLCKKIIELHNGRIHAESDGKNGSVFIIRLPTKPTEQRT